tara:strand:- start:421634 stop:422425 length:792 start_codon:yes stop_codon:yes gene_type:complete
MMSVGSAQQQWAGFALPDANAFTGSADGSSGRNTLSRNEPELALAMPENDPTGETTEKPHEFSLFGDDGLTFGDLIDVVNPLQHIPIIATIYREMTNDALAAGPRMLGGTLFFGPVGLATAVANVALEETTGKDIGDHLVNFVAPDEDESPAMAIAFAANQNNTPMSPTATATLAQDPVSAWARNEVEWARSQGNKTPSIESDTPNRLPDAEPFLRQPENWAMNTQQVAVLNDDVRAAAHAYRAAAGLQLRPDASITSASGRS